MKYHHLIFCITLLLFTLDQTINAQFKLSGRVRDEKGEALAFASVYKKGSTNGSISNNDGQYELELSKGTHVIIFQYLGYKSEAKTLEIDENVEFNISLEPESIDIKEIIFEAGEDPSIPIIKAAIKKREENKKITQSFKAELYIKALMKIYDTPLNFLGNNLGNLDGVLDSNRQGILYFSESLSNINFAPPNFYKEELISSKVSGDDRGISVNQFSYANFNFYNENINLFRGLISPLSDDALAYYNFYLYEKFTDKNGQLVNKIKVKPKSDFRPCFSGFIYINDSLYNINSLELSISGDAIKNAVLDSINIHQVFVPVAESKNWFLITQNISFKIKFLVFKTKGNFNYIFKNYNFQPEFAKKFFGNEIFAVKKDAIKNDTMFWIENRPLPLTIEESNDYITKDKIAKITNAPAYLDSVDRANRKFKLIDILFGYNASKSISKINYGLNSPLMTFQFNAVEGGSFSAKPYFNKGDKDDNTIINADGTLRYGIADKKWKWKVENRWNYDYKNLGHLNVAFGNDYFQYNEKNIVSPFGNTMYSIYFKENTAKLFQKRFVEINWGRELINGLTFETSISYAKRNSLENQTNYSVLKEELNYAPNNPYEKSGFKFTDKIFKQTFGIKWSPGQKYQSYPSYKVRIPSKAPNIFLNLDLGLALNNEFVDFAKLKLSLVDNYVATKIFGYFMYRVEAGSFLRKENINIIDYFHFKGNQLVTGFRSPYLQTFKLQDDYEFSSSSDYVALWAEQHFDGFLFDKIPILNKLGITGIFGISALNKKEYSYIEPGIGIEGIKIGAIDLMRIDYFWGFKDGKLSDKGLRLGFSTFFENIFGDK